ncbi:MAG: RagB/SusD family nutrient uptake outer membrane protein [Tannerellaceae bacterium]|jgi:hypothetical protein|nr:RagB/SusD family nutrient uptake outer membrane protein [Tannerellaceae bacterium]
MKTTFNINRSFLRLALVPVLAFTLACDNLLQPEPTTEISDNRSIYDEKSATAALNGTYDNLKESGYYGLDLNFITYLFADNVKFVGIQTYYKIFIRPDGYGKTSLQSDNSALAGVWSAIYKTINSANHLIEKVPLVDDPNFTQEERNDILGQAYFIRALSYFDLSRFWGGVQLVLKPTTSPNDVVGIKRSSLEDTYAQVLADLAEAEARLTPKSSRIFVDLGAVQALAARIALYREEWEKAETYASRLIGNEKYALVKPYAVFYTTKASTESIFELEFTVSESNPSSNWWRPSELGGRYEASLNDVIVGLLKDPATGGNRGDLVLESERRKEIYNGFYWRGQRDDPEYLFRIAEQYLIRAEARARRNNLAGSLEDLNAVRERADVPPLDSQSYDTLDKALQALEKERRIEFAVENHRFFDLRRTNRLGAVLGEDEGYLFPIPLNQLDRDPYLEPNPSN